MIRMEELYDIGFEKERESKSYESCLKRGRIERKSYIKRKSSIERKRVEKKRFKREFASEKEELYYNKCIKRM